MASWAWGLTFIPTSVATLLPEPAVPVTDLQGASIITGKPASALSYSGGTMVMRFDNSSGKYTPGGGGTYHGARFIGVEVKLYADVTGSGAPSWTHGAPAVFTGVVTNVAWTYRSAFESYMTVTVADRLTMLATLSFEDVDSGNGLDIGAGSASAALTATLVAANAITDVIDQTSILNPSGDVGESLQAITDYRGTAGALAGRIEQSDGGDVFVRHGLPIAAAPNDYNALTFRTRGQKPISESVTGVTGLYALNLWDTSLSSSGDEPHSFGSVDFVAGAAMAYSQVEFQSVGGTAQRETSPTAAIDLYGGRSITRSGLYAASDAATLSLAEAFLDRYGVRTVPPVSVQSISMPPVVTGDNDGWQLTKYSIGDACTINYDPAGASAAIEIQGVISGVSWAITPSSATMTISLEDGDQTVSLILDSAIYGILDTNRLG